MSERSRRFLWLVMFLGAGLAAARAEDTDVRKQVEHAMEKIYPGLVQVLVVVKDYRNGREQKYQGAGSGSIISAEGHVITNYHVAGKAKNIRCRLSNREEVDATLVGADPLVDIAILKINLAEIKDQKFKLVVAEFGDSDKVKVGMRVLAMGCPVALSQSVTMGIVSNTGFVVPSLFWPFTFKMEGEEVGTLVKWIGFDAQIFGGNSGGPLVSMDGKIVGINEIGIGLGGAIPSNVAREAAEQIIQSGSVKRSWTGIRCQPLLKGSGQQQGALVAEVFKGSPAEAAGVKPGDIILEYYGKPVAVRFAEELPNFNQLLCATPVGDKAPLTLLRASQTINLDLTTTLREPARGEEKELRAWGVTARQLTALAALELKRASKEGAFVWSVRPGGPASEAKPAVLDEDVIVAVNGTPIKGLAHLEEVTQALIKGKEKPVPTVVAFERKGERLLTVVKLGVSSDDDKAGDMSKAWLGAAYQVLTQDLAEALKLKKGTCGVRLTQILPQSPAGEAGLKAGDLITHLDGEVIQSSQPEEVEVLRERIRQYKIGAEAEFTVLREPAYEKMLIKVKLGGNPKPEAQMKTYKDQNFDFEVRDIAYMDRVKEDWDKAQSGALVTAVEPGGWAALAHLGVGDLILALDGKPIANVAALETYMKAVAEKKPRQVTFFVLHDTHTTFVELEIVWSAKQ